MGPSLVEHLGWSLFLFSLGSFRHRSEKVNDEANVGATAQMWFRYPGAL